VRAARNLARETIEGAVGRVSDTIVRKVVETGLEPEIDTGISHKQAGIGQIGAGLTVAPMACFAQAVEAFAALRGAAGAAMQAQGPAS